jgi:hypothetical protein
VRILLAGVGVRRIHRLCDAVRNGLAISAVFRPWRNRVAQVLAEYALERLDFARLLQASEQIVERAVSNMMTTTWSMALLRS